MAFKFNSPIAVAISDFDDMCNETTEIEEVVRTHEDVIAMSCVMYRLNQITDVGDRRQTRRFFSLEHEAAALAKLINQEDRLMAQAIRRYYNGKLTLQSLRGQPFTKFRQDLVNLLAVENVDGRYEYATKYLGMAYKLPYFYEYDMSLNDVFGSEYFELSGKGYYEGTSTLSFIKKLDAFRKREPVHEYWFSDENDDRVVIRILKANPLVSVFDHILQDKELTISGKFKAARKDTLEFYTAEYWNAEFN